MNPLAPCINTSSSSSSTTTSSEIIPRSSSSSIKPLSPDDFKSPSYPQYTQSPSVSARSSTPNAAAAGATATSHMSAPPTPNGGRPLAETPRASPQLKHSRRPYSPKISPSKPSSPAVAHKPSNLSTATPSTPTSTSAISTAPSPNECPAPPVAPSTPTTSPCNTIGDASPPKRARYMDPSIKALPQLYQYCPSPDLVYLISDMLLELVGLNDKIPLSGAGLTRFHSRAPPTISIPDYLSRLALHASLQPSILLSMVYYIDILSTHYSPFVVSSLTVHRFLITAATVASKGLCDSFLTNGFYAKVGGVSLMELNRLELEFLVRVGWRIVPKGEVLGEYYKSLVGRLQNRYTIEDADESVNDSSDGFGISRSRSESRAAEAAGPAGR